MPDDDRLDTSEDGSDQELYEETPRSIFAATWFRAVLVLIVLGAIGAIAVPYILDAMNPSTKTGVASRSTDAPAPPATTPAPSAMSQPSGALPTQPDNTPADAPVPERAAAEKRTPPASKARKPLAGNATAKADKSAPGERPTGSAKLAASPKPAPSDKSTPDKTTAAEKTDTAMVPPAPDTKTDAKAPAGTAKPAAARGTTAAGDWWVQVGAFRDETAAKKVAGQLRDQSYNVEESVRAGGAGTTKSAAETPAASAGAVSITPAVDQYDVFVSGTSAAELTARLAAKGLSAEPSGAGAVVKPSLPLRDAVALSKDLAVDGLKVQVRRATGATNNSAPAAADKRPARKDNAGDTLYRVRIGAFSDRATALTTLKELEAKGYKPFIARGGS